tara:strand:- start:152 stop:466 length:315 start_codon:yes stop_codon:yes gene_type:complete
MLKRAKEHIAALFQEADKIFSSNPKRANRHTNLARKTGMKLKTKLTSEQKRKFCKHCKTYLRPGNNSRVRIRDNKIIIYCQNCRKYTRIPINKKKQRKATRSPP